MAGLMDAVSAKRSGGLKKAADAEHDPADLAKASANTSANTNSGNAGVVDSDPASVSASGNTSSTDSDAASVDDSATASTTASGKAGQKASKSTSTSASTTASKAAAQPAAGKASESAAKKAKKARRVGRPAGPERTPVTVRILAEHDDALTAAVEDTGMSPQYVIDDALRGWFAERGYLQTKSASS